MTSSALTAKPQSSPSRGPGRPREFDLDCVLESAVRVFQQRGYHAASIGDLAEGMGLSTGSLYKAFKDKRGIFLAAYDRMTQQRTAEMRALLELPVSGREMLRLALMHYVEQSSSAQGRQGCLVVATAVELSTLDDEIAERVAATFRQRQQALAEMVERGQADGSIAARIDTADAARLVFCLLQGMRVLGKTGPAYEELAKSVELALQALD
jgi:AcrR family transcriptional regulator